MSKSLGGWTDYITGAFRGIASAFAAASIASRQPEAHTADKVGSP
jgi:hypothetical protein